MKNKDRLNRKALLPLIITSPVVFTCVWFLQTDRAVSTEGALSSEGVLSAEKALNAEETVSAEKTLSEATAAAVKSVTKLDAEPPFSKGAAPRYQTPDSLGENPFADSLAGTDIDGSLRADAYGQLIIDLATRDFFNYFLNTIGEVPAEQALEQIETLAMDSLPETAAKEAIALLNQYLDYKDATLAMGNEALDPARQHDPAYQLKTLKGALADMKQLRRHMFAADAHEAFFGLEEAYGDYTLASLEIQQRTDLSGEAKSTLMAWHRQQLPDVIRRTETRMMEEGNSHRARQQALAQADSPADAGRRLRKLGVDDAQVSEVVAYMEERERFGQDYQQFRQALASLDTSGLAEEDRAAQESQLLEQHFEDEQTRTWARLRALDAQSP